MTKPIKPITPAEVAGKKRGSLPPEVLTAFNELIAAAWDGRLAVVKQDAAATLIASRLDITREEVFRRHYLDVEDVYREAGWKVDYDKPSYNENYPATFKFSKGGKA